MGFRTMRLNFLTFEFIMARILVIEDTASVLAGIQKVLAGAGHEVITCSGGNQGLSYLRQGHIDLVITDIFMAEGDGLEVIRHTRQFSPDTKLIAISGRPAETNQFAVACALGACCTLQKPFSAEGLLKVVATLLDSYHNALAPDKAGQGDRSSR